MMVTLFITCEELTVVLGYHGPQYQVDSTIKYSYVRGPHRLARTYADTICQIDQ